MTVTCRGHPGVLASAMNPRLPVYERHKISSIKCAQDMGGVPVLFVVSGLAHGATSA